MGDYFDAKFEADCPKFVDFTVPQDLEDNADEWFNFDHENGVPVNFEDSQKEVIEKSNHDNKDKSTIVTVTSPGGEEYHECNLEPVTKVEKVDQNEETSQTPSGPTQSQLAKDDLSQPDSQKSPPQVNGIAQMESSDSDQIAKDDSPRPALQKALPQVCDTPMDSSDSDAIAKDDLLQPALQKAPPRVCDAPMESSDSDAIAKDDSPQPALQQAPPLVCDAPMDSSDSDAIAKDDSPQPALQKAPPRVCDALMDSSDSDEIAKDDSPQPALQKAQPRVCDAPMDSSDSDEIAKDYSPQPALQRAPPRVCDTPMDSSDSDAIAKDDSPQPALQKAPSQVNDSIPPVDISDSDQTMEDVNEEPQLMVADLTPDTGVTDSPALPLQQKPSVLQHVAAQDNLALITLSAENTPKAEEKKETQVVETTKPKPNNIMTSWSDDETDTTKPQHNKDRPARQTTRTKKVDTDRSTFTRSNSLRRSTRRSAVNVSATNTKLVETAATAKKRSSSVDSLRKRRSASATRRAPSVESARIRRSSPQVAAAARLRRSSPHVATSNVVVDLAKKRRSVPHTGRTPSKDLSMSGKRKRRSSPPSNTRKSPRLQNDRPKLTMPQTPNCLRRNNSKLLGQSKFKSSEQLELEKIAQMKAEAKKTLALSKKSHHHAQESNSYYPTRSKQEPTRPMEFKFETDSRLKNHSMETRQDKEMKDFVGALRKHPRSPSKSRGPTVQKPFQFSNTRKRHNEESDPSGVAGKYKPMALQIAEFHRRTPERFRTKVANDVGKGPIPMKAVHSKPSLTCPKTPNLETRSRKRVVTTISAAEKEELEVQEMKSHTFRARPVDPRVMSNLNIGVMKPSHKSPTKVVGFNLECERRIREREATRQPEDEETHEFHAQELNPKILQGTIGIAPVKTIPLTCPKSPAFALKNRVRTVRVPTSPEEVKESSRILHANPIPHTGVPFLPNLDHKVTEAQPFSFENRDKEMMARKEAKISKMKQEEEQLHGQFKAQPLPSYDHPKLPEKKVKPITRPEPFMSVEERATRQAQEWSKKMEEELNEQRQQASGFKAKPADVLYEAPFVPLKSNKALTDVSDFELNTDRRAVERQGFEEHKHMREAEIRVANEERQRREEEEERKAVERLRQEMVHKSNPVRSFKPVQVLPSMRPLTQPESPHFATDSRLRNQPRL